MTNRRPFVAANWKMNGNLASIRPLLADILAGVQTGVNAEVVICPPYIYIDEIALRLDNTTVELGAQNVSQYDSGAHTGEVAIGMLQDYNTGYVIIGHSERRMLYGETDIIVAEKFKKVVDSGLKPILCVGETLEQREADETEEVIARQLDTVIDNAGVKSFAKAVIAYEPVWAIGTGRTATPDQAQEVHAFIRLRLARHDEEIADLLRIVYGGSVKADNANELFTMADIDGGLIGGASLIAEDFLSICHAAI
jgi:triosephosphate isomerase